MLWLFVDTYDPRLNVNDFVKHIRSRCLLETSSLNSDYTVTMISLEKVDYNAIVIGAGFGGIRTLWELRRLGLSVKGFEAGSDVGGAWYWNRYPGARTDSEGWVYAMNFTPGLCDEWDYKERYPGQEEVQRYLHHIAGQSSVSCWPLPRI